MPLPRHAKLNRIMLKKCDVKKNVSFIKKIRYAYNIIPFF